MTNRREKRAQLRALECLAYSSTLSYLRAHQDCNDQTKLILDHLRPLLHISAHRHRAELRRILNDDDLERLATSKHQWMELDDHEEENEQKTNAPSSTTTSGTKKKLKASSTST